MPIGMDGIKAAQHQQQDWGCNMKKSIFLAIALLVFSVQAWAAPYLVCDPDSTGVTKEYVLSFDGGPEISTSHPLHYDVGDLEDGDHQVQVKAKNVWGESVPVSFDFTKGVPGQPTNIIIQ